MRAVCRLCKWEGDLEGGGRGGCRVQARDLRPPAQNCPRPRVRSSSAPLLSGAWSPGPRPGVPPTSAEARGSRCLCAGEGAGRALRVHAPSWENCPSDCLSASPALCPWLSPELLHASWERTIFNSPLVACNCVRLRRPPISATAAQLCLHGTHRTYTSQSIVLTTFSNHLKM